VVGAELGDAGDVVAIGVGGDARAGVGVDDDLELDGGVGGEGRVDRVPVSEIGWVDVKGLGFVVRLCGLGVVVESDTY